VVINFCESNKMDTGPETPRGAFTEGMDRVTAFPALPALPALPAPDPAGNGRFCCSSAHTPFLAACFVTFSDFIRYCFIPDL
jgi:hypothetical protein